MVWTHPDAKTMFPEMRSNMAKVDWSERGPKSGLKQMIRDLDEKLEGHERLIDDALRARGFLTFTEFQAHRGKGIAAILEKRVIKTFLQCDLAKRVLEGGVPLNSEEWAILVASVATYDPEKDRTIIDLSKLDFDLE